MKNFGSMEQNTGDTSQIGTGFMVPPRSLFEIQDDFRNRLIETRKTIFNAELQKQMTTQNAVGN
jgi:hypothetical protein